MPGPEGEHNLREVEFVFPDPSGASVGAGDTGHTWIVDRQGFHSAPAQALHEEEKESANRHFQAQHPWYDREHSDLVVGPGPNGELRIMFATVPRVGEEDATSTLTPRSCTEPDALGVCHEVGGTGEMGYCGCMCLDGRFVKFCDANYQKCGAYESCNCKGSPCTLGQKVEVGYDPLSQLCNILGSMTLIGLCGYLHYRKGINAFVKDPIGWFKKRNISQPKLDGLTPGLEPA